MSLTLAAVLTTVCTSPDSSSAPMCAYQMPSGYTTMLGPSKQGPRQPLAVTLTLVSVILMAGSLSMVSIVRAQESLHVWFGFVQPLAFVIFFIGGLAETNRSPFDLPEAEQELTGGFHTEYSGMRFALFFLAEYANMIVVSSVATTLFLGGWLRPFPNVAALGFLDIIPSWTWFLAKSFVFLYVFIWVRATLPRYRYDQLMAIGWKLLIPLAIANLVVTGIVKVMLL